MERPQNMKTKVMFRKRRCDQGECSDGGWNGNETAGIQAVERPTFAKGSVLLFYACIYINGT
jgi:hypothetical protein